MTTRPFDDDAADESFSGVVHDLGNYIQVAISAVSILSRNPDIAASRSATEVLTHATYSLARAGDLVRRSMLPDDRLNEDDISIETSLAAAVPLIHYACGPDVRIKLQLGRLPRVRCNPRDLEGALLNLALNARDAMPTGGTLSLTALLADGPEVPEVEIGVSDTGSGMAPEILARVLEPYFTTKQSADGHGLGLASVRRWVESVDGRLFLTSKPGHGTTVTLRLPVSR
jgi:signal transduction histidine kinase